MGSSVGPRNDALDGIRIPANAIVNPYWPQMKVLRLTSTSLFVTHCGHGSFMESLLCGVPVVACPCFGDQPTNAAVAERNGVGLKINPPVTENVASAAEPTAAYIA